MDSVIHHLNNWGQKCSRDNSKVDTFLHCNVFIAFGSFLLTGPLLVHCVYRGEVLMSCCHGSKIFGWKQTNKVTYQSIRTISNFTVLVQFHLIWQILAKFPLGPYLLLSKFRKRKWQFLCCVPLLYKAGSRNRNFHAVVVQQR